MGSNKKYMRMMLGIALPIALQNLINFAVNLMDTVMLGQLGEMPLAASSLANQVFFVVTLVVYGIGGGANVLVSQYWGRGDTKSIHRILSYTYRTAVGFACVAAAAAVFVPELVMRLFTKEEAVILLGAGYLRIVGISYLLFTITTVTTCMLRAVHTVRIAMVLSAVSLCVNVAINYILIFGKFGAPKLGIIGAAIGTLCARAVEFVILLWFVFARERQLNIRLHFTFGARKASENATAQEKKALLKLYCTTSIPVVINELFWALGESAVAMILGRMGMEIVSANAIYANISELSGVVVSGMNSAACVIVGNVVGAGAFDELGELKKRFQGVSVVVGLLGMAIMLICRGFVIDFYKVSDVTKVYASQIMLIGSAVELFRSIQCMNIMGILRGAGDVTFAMLNDLIFLWGFTIPFGILAGLVWKWPVAAVYVALKLDQLLKIFTSEYRLRGKKWIKAV